MGVLVVLTKKGFLFKGKKKRGRKVLIVRLNEVLSSLFYIQVWHASHTKNAHGRYDLTFEIHVLVDIWWNQCNHSARTFATRSAMG